MVPLIQSVHFSSSDKQTLNLPRFRNPPQVDCPSTNHCTVSFSAWNRNSDDGELVEGNEIIG